MCSTYKTLWNSISHVWCGWQWQYWYWRIRTGTIDIYLLRIVGIRFEMNFMFVWKAANNHTQSDLVGPASSWHAHDRKRHQGQLNAQRILFRLGQVRTSHGTKVCWFSKEPPSRMHQKRGDSCFKNTIFDLNTFDCFDKC